MSQNVAEITAVTSIREKPRSDQPEFVIVASTSLIQYMVLARLLTCFAHMLAKDETLFPQFRRQY